MKKTHLEAVTRAHIYASATHAERGRFDVIVLYLVQIAEQANCVSDTLWNYSAVLSSWASIRHPLLMHVSEVAI